MKFPTIQQLYVDLTAVIKRFPLQVIIAIAATVSACLYINLTAHSGDNFYHEVDYYAKFALISNLALTLLLAIDLFCEVHHVAPPKKFLFRGIAVVVSTVLFFLLDPLNNVADAYRTAMLAFAFHLLVAFAPFIGKQHINGFWQFNKALFLRILTSALYSIVLVAGLMIALGAIRGLFSVDIKSETYLTVVLIIIVGFNTIFFLAGLPVNIGTLDEEHSYPKGLKIFTQFVLIPLMTLYLIILLVYEVKIIFLWELPRGMVAGLILGYAVFGILSLLLIYPIRNKADQGWIKLFSRFFYLMMVPLIVLLMLAVWKRIDHYGITESRYILIILALWLAGVTCYFLFSKKDNIKVIPISLCVLALLSCYGPQSAFAVSKYSQLSRLKSLQHATRTKDIIERLSIVRYLVDTHGLTTLQSFTNKNLAAVEEKIEKQQKNRYTQREAKTDTALSILNLSKDKKITGEPYQRITFVNDQNEILQVAGYDYVLEMMAYEQEPIAFYGHKIKTERDDKRGMLTLNLDEKQVLSVDLNRLYKEVMVTRHQGNLKRLKSANNYYFPGDRLKFTGNSAGYQFTIVITNLYMYDYGDEPDDKLSGNSIKSYLLIKKI